MSATDAPARQGLSRTAAGQPVPSARERAAGRLAHSDPALGWIVTATITLIAGFLRLWDLGRPNKFQFDETYYAKDAWSMLNLGYAATWPDDANDKIMAGSLQVWNDSPQMIVHPEFGKWIIGLGIKWFGMDPFGWRIASAVVGTLMVLVMIRLARRVTGSTMLGAVAGILMAADGMQFVLSRLALLDIFAAFFTLCAVSCLVADRDWGRRKLADRIGDGIAAGARPWLLWRPWRLASGVFWGLSVGTKWSSLYLLAACGILMWLWDAGARRSFGVRLSLVRSAFMDALPGVGYVVILPALIYIGSWTGWLMNYGLYEKHLSNNGYGPYWGNYIKTKPSGFFAELFRPLRSLWNYHLDMWNFHTTGLEKATHSYQSNPLGWLLQTRGVGIDAENGIPPGAQGCEAAKGSTCLRQVLLLGTPLLWWSATLAFLASVVAWIGRRDWRYGLVVVGVVFTWLPWLSSSNRPIFSYYAILTEPFLILGLTLILGEILGRAGAGARRRQIGGVLAGTVVIGIVINFVWFWPIYTDALLTREQWLWRMWFHHWI